MNRRTKSSKTEKGVVKMMKSCDCKKILVSLDLEECSINLEDGMTEMEMKELIKENIIDSLNRLARINLIYTCAVCGKEIDL